MGGDGSKPLGTAVGKRRPRGLVNFGSTCYFNATITALFASAEFQGQMIGERWPQNDDLTVALLALHKELMKRKATAVSPREAFSRLSKLRPEWTTHHQQDAHELLNFLLNHLDDCHDQQTKDAAGKVSRRFKGSSAFLDSCSQRVLSPSTQSELAKAPQPGATSPLISFSRALENTTAKELPTTQSVVSLFEGSVAHVTRCLACDSTSTTLEKYYDLSVDMAPTLEQCLKDFCRTEYMKPTEKYYCEECQQHQGAVRFCSLREIPRVTIFQLKRFRYDPQSGSLSKIRDVCRFPLVLELPLTVGERYERLGSLSATNNVAMDAQPVMEEALVKLRRHLRVLGCDGVETSGGGDHENYPAYLHTLPEQDGFYKQQSDAVFEDMSQHMKTDKRQRLELCAVVCHLGSFLSAGHYVAVVRSGGNNWWLVDDEEVVPVSWAQMTQFCGGIPLRGDKRLGESVRTENAYLLFYESSLRPKI